MAPRILVISGGTALNSILGIFDAFSTTHVLSVSDNGGSSSEILRVVGGPSIGDIRSRLVRIIPTRRADLDDQNVDDSAALAIQRLMAYRLPFSEDTLEAKKEYHEIVEGTHWLWTKIPQDKKECIRSFLVHFNTQILHRAHKRFDFRNASIGNMFLSGAQMFFRNLESAIFLFAAIASIPGSISVIPAIHTNHRTTIAARLEDGTVHVGQCAISHPSTKKNTQLCNAGSSRSGKCHAPSNLLFDKELALSNALASRIDHLYYINEYGQEIYPMPNEQYLQALASNEVLVYGIGSLYTSIMPCLALRSIGRCIAQSPKIKAKILLLNAYNDRETPEYNALDFIMALVTCLRRFSFSEHSHQYHLDGSKAGIDTLTEMQSHSILQKNLSLDSETNPPTPTKGIPSSIPDIPVLKFITDLIYLQDGTIEVDVPSIERLGIRCLPAASCEADGRRVYDDRSLTLILDKLAKDLPPH